MCYLLILTKVDAESVIGLNWTVVVDDTSDGRPIVYQNDRQALSTARFRRVARVHPRQLIVV